MRTMIKKTLLFLILILPLVLLANLKTADPERIWLIKTKTKPVYTLWTDGRITLGEPHTTTETITLQPNEYVYANRWFVRGNAIYTPWARKPLIYSFESKQGACSIGLSAKNFAGGGQGWTKPTGYTHFKVEVYVDNEHKGRLNIEASDTEINTDYLDIEQLDKGTHDIKFVWTNDKWRPGQHQDANIEVHNVSIEQRY